MKKLIITAALTIGAAFSQQCSDQIGISHKPYASGTAILEVYGEHGEYHLFVRAGSTEELGTDATVSIRTTDGARYSQPVRFASRTKAVRITFMIGDGREVEQVNLTQKGDTGFGVSSVYTDPFPYGRCK